jgi:hypothetical protein
VGVAKIISVSTFAPLSEAIWEETPDEVTS